MPFFNPLLIAKDPIAEAEAINKGTLGFVRGAQKIGEKADQFTGEQLLSSTNPDLFRFYEARRRLTGVDATPEEYFMGIRRGVDPSYQGPNPVSKFISETARGAAGPVSRVGAAAGGTVGSVVPGIGTTLGAATGGGLSFALMRNMANLLNPESAGRNPLLDVAEAGAGYALGGATGAILRKTPAGRAVLSNIERLTTKVKPKKARNLTESDASNRRLEDLRSTLDTIMPPKKEAIARTTSRFKSNVLELVDEETGVALTPSELKALVRFNPGYTPGDILKYLNLNKAAP